ncbi:MAG: response regulator [Nitrospinae bacterium]|nr:response regulator [Nitrospinota bacterium]
MNDKWKLLVVDDNTGIHEVTRIVLSDFVFEGRCLQIINAYSAKDGMKMLDVHPDIAVALIDVAMESENAGLELLGYIRKEKELESIQIIVRTEKSFHEIATSCCKDVAFTYYYVQKSSLSPARLRHVVSKALQRFKEDIH